MNKISPVASLITSRDVANLAGVSRSAVSRTFTPGASVSTKTRDKVLKASSELGYSVNLVARGLNKQRTDLVGMIVSRMDNPYRASQIDALAKQLVRQGFRPMLFCIDDGMDAEQLLSILLNYQVSGVVITSDAPPAKICAECARMHVPLVLVDRTDALPNVDWISSDNNKGGRLAAAALIDAGRRKLLVLQPETMVFTTRERTNAFIEYAAEAGLSTKVMSVGTLEYYSGFEAGKDIAAYRDQGLGVFCPTDTIALGLLDALRNEHHVDVPGEVSIIGYDDIPQAAWKFSQLTTIKQPVDEFARITVDLLKERIANPDAEPKFKLVEVTVIKRGTV